MYNIYQYKDYLLIIISFIVYFNIRKYISNIIENNEVIDFFFIILIVIKIIDIKQKNVVEKFNSIGENVDYEMLQYISSLVSDPNRPLTVSNLRVTNKLDVEGGVNINNADSNKGLKIKNGGHHAHIYHGGSNFIISGNRSYLRSGGMGLYSDNHAHFNSSANVNDKLTSNKLKVHHGTDGNFTVHGQMHSRSAKVNSTIEIDGKQLEKKHIEALKGERHIGIRNTRIGGYFLGNHKNGEKRGAGFKSYDVNNRVEHRFIVF